MFIETNSSAITSKSNNIFSIFFCIPGSYVNVKILWKKRWASEIISFSNYGLQKSGLLKWPKSPISEHLWIVNMLKGPKGCLNKSAGPYFCNLFLSLYFFFIIFFIKKPRIRTLMDSLHVKGSETLQKSARQWSLWKKISSKNSVLVVSEILRVLVKILSLGDKYSLSVKRSV